jgi:hypothetical protein
MEIEPYNIIRMMVVIISGVSIFFGYRLFSTVTERQGTLKIAGQESTLELSDVGPGVFFSLFGSIVLVAVLWTQPYEETNSKNSITGVTDSTRTPSSVGDEADGGVPKVFIFDFENVCVTAESLEHFTSGLSLSAWLFEKVSNEPFGEVDEDSRRMINDLLEVAAGGNFKVLGKELLINTDGYNLVNAYLIMYSLKNHC